MKHIYKAVFIFVVLCCLMGPKYVEAVSDGTQNNIIPISGGEFRVTDDAAATNTRLIVQDATGEVGINVADPQAALQVVSPGANTTPVAIFQSTGTQGGDVQFFVSDNASGPEGNITADVGDVVLNTNLGRLYVKSSTSGDALNWTNVTPPSNPVTIERYTQTIAAGASYALTHSNDASDKRLVQVYADTVGSPGGYDAGDSMTPYDPNNYSTLDANINNGNLTDLWYNNSVTGSTGKWIGLFSSTAITVDRFRIYDWNAAYYSTSFNFDYSNDGSSWITAMTITGHPFSPNPGREYTLPSSATGRYFRVISTTGGPVNATYWVLSELELSTTFVASGPPNSLVSADDFTIQRTSATQTTIINNTGNSRNCVILVMKES